MFFSSKANKFCKIKPIPLFFFFDIIDDVDDESYVISNRNPGG